MKKASKNQKTITIKEVENYSLLNEIELFNMAKNALLKGDVLPEKLFFFFRMFSKTAELLNKDAETKDIIQNALERYDKQNLYGYGVQVTHRKNFDYDGTGSAYLQVLKLRKMKAEQELKEYQEFLEKVDSETTNAKEEGIILKPITFTRTKIVSIVKPYKEAA